MWGRHKKLQKWVEAGLITETQAITIQAFEDSRKKGKFGRGLVGLSIFSILIGILSIIASNWHAIPGEIKIGGHVILNAVVGYGAFRAMQAGNTIWREGLTLAFFGLTMTLIILTGQVFQLTGDIPGALMFWMVVTLPFMLIFSQNWMSALPWTIAFLTTVGFVADKYIEDLPLLWQQVYITGLTVLLPLALFGDGSLDCMKRLKPAWADVFQKTGAVLLAIVASFSTIGLTHAFYSSQEFQDQPYAYLLLLSPFAIGLAGIAFHGLTHRLYRDDERAKYGALFATVSVLFSALPVISFGLLNSFFGALFFIAYWVFVGWIAQATGMMRIVSVAIFLIAIRIFIVYIEIFGSLMSTGIGLIVGGVVMLALLFAARRMNMKLTRKVELQA